MIRSVICLVAEGAIRDAETNNVSIFNILEGITGVGFPLFVQRLAFFALWERAAEDSERVAGTFTVRIAARELHTQPVQIDFQGRLKNRTFITMQGLVIPQPGPLSFSLALDGGPTATYTVEANAPASAVQTDVTPSPHG